jgi:hypothetical protein
MEVVRGQSDDFERDPVFRTLPMEAEGERHCRAGAGGQGIQY